MKLLQLLVCSSVFAAFASGTAVIDPNLKQRFSLSGLGGSENVMVSFTQGIQTVIQQIDKMNFSSMAEKRSVLTNAQKSFSDASQKPLQTLLNGMGVNYETFWISNAMVVPNANSAIVNAIANAPGVAKVEKEPVVNLDIPFVGEPEEVNFSRLARQSESDPAWGVKKIRANQVWGSYKGKGIVVANIDTGVRRTHEALRSNYRTSYGWYDPYEKSSTPNDGNGHGTHTMGTIAGQNGIGVAPEATWIACKGCNSNSCGGSQLMACGQWVQCPTDTAGNNQNCDMAPDVVSNSWGGGGGSTWYNNIIRSWQSSGIIPVFSIGNSGPNCNTAGSPGDQPNLISVGSTDSSDRISSFSSLGPAPGGNIKPEISAPGGQVYSAWYNRDNSYNTISGTSMACPHVSGVVALMLQKNPSANYDAIFKAITKDPETSGLNTSNAKTCGNRSPRYFPNNVFGYGRIDAVNSVNNI